MGNLAKANLLKTGSPGTDYPASRGRDWKPSFCYGWTFQHGVKLGGKWSKGRAVWCLRVNCRTRLLNSAERLS